MSEKPADQTETYRALLGEAAARIEQTNLRGSTHWEGCETSHADCALIKRIKDAIGRDAVRCTCPGGPDGPLGRHNDCPLHGFDGTEPNSLGLVFGAPKAGGEGG